MWKRRKGKKSNNDRKFSKNYYRFQRQQCPPFRQATTPEPHELEHLRVTQHILQGTTKTAIVSVQLSTSFQCKVAPKRLADYWKELWIGRINAPMWLKLLRVEHLILSFTMSLAMACQLTKPAREGEIVFIHTGLTCTWLQQNSITHFNANCRNANGSIARLKYRLV